MPIKVNNLNYSYNTGTIFENTALHDISFEINDNEFIGIIGSTGSGKSTLVQHLNGLIKPVSGQIEINGVDITSKQTNMTEIRKLVGLVFQYPEYQLFEETVERDVSYGPMNLGYSKEKIKERVDFALSAVGLNSEEIRGKSPFDLSGGQKRRVAIAGILAMDTKVLILDEPTSGLDPKTRNEIMKLIYDEHLKSSRITILVSHSMEDVAKYADRVLVLDKGRIRFFDTPENIFSNSKELSELGLDLPEITKLIIDLNASGFNIDTSIYDVNDLCDALIDEGVINA